MMQRAIATKPTVTAKSTVMSSRRKKIPSWPTSMSIPAICILILTLLSGCSDDSTDTLSPTEQADTEQTTPETSSASDTAGITERGVRSLKLENAAISAFISEIDQYFANLQAEAETLHTRVIAFAKAPSEETLDDSIAAWELAHDLYLAGYFLDPLFNGLLALETEDQPLPDLHTRLDTYPMLPGYLDSVSGYPLSGLIHSDIPLTLSTMYQEFQLGDAAYVTLGFHALEVMLKGTDKERVISEFAAIKATKESGEASPELRRTLYSSLLAEQIRTDMQQLPAKWRQQIKNLLFNLDESQTKNLKSRLADLVRQQTNAADPNAKTNTPDASEHLSEQAKALNEQLKKNILTSLESKTSP